MTKTKRRRRYRPTRTRWLTLENISLVKQFFVTVGPIVVAAYLWVIPQIQAQAADYVRGQFIAVGMDPATIQALNKNLAELQETVKEKDEAVEKLSDEFNDLKMEIGKALIILQERQPIPAPATEPVK
jgi:uncharacterized coiled-coil protein SlyX